MILDSSMRFATKVVLSSLRVHFESWQFPIPTFIIFIEAFKSLSCSVSQFKQTIERIDKSSLPHLYPQLEM